VWDETRIVRVLMNIIAVDIGNTNISVGLFLDGKEDFIRTISGRS